MILKLLRLNICYEERRTFQLHLAYSIIEGSILGVLALNEFVFIKSLKGSNYELGILFQSSMLVFVLLIFVNEFLQRIKYRRKFMRWVGVLTRFPLLLLIFFPRNEAEIDGNSYYHFLFLLIFLIYYMAALVVNPTINLLLKKNYNHQNFGKLYSYSSSANKVVMLFVTFFYGQLLDFDHYAFVYVFPVVSIFGMTSIYLLSQIDYDPPERIVAKGSILQSVMNSTINMYGLLKANRPYRHFEMSFMLYGFAFMITYALTTIFFYNQLNLNYSSVAFYKNSYNILAIILLPVFGKIMGKVDPRKFSVVTYSSLAIFLFFLMITEYFPAYFIVFDITIYYTLIVYIVFQGLFAASMVLIWNIGSAYFGRDDEADIYQSTHLFLTGTRAMFAPLLGIFFYELFGYSVTFSIAIFFLILAIILMIWSYKQGQTLSSEFSQT